MREFSKRMALLAVFVCLSSSAWGQKKTELHVAAASDMHPVLDIVGPMFEQKTGVHLVVSYGASATLSHQILAGSPVDIFFSADYVFAERIVAAGLGDSKTAVPYAKGALVLWVRKPVKASLDLLHRKDLKTIAIANPDTAPYGRAAVFALKKMKLYDALSPRFVQAENIMQAAQFAESGNAQIGLISQTIAESGKFKAEGTYALFPLYAYPEIRQCAVVMKNSPHRDEAHKLLDFILSEQIQDNLGKVGLRRVQ